MIASLIRDNNSYFGLAIGFTVLAGAVVGGGLSGGAFNAAVGLALPLLAGSPVQVRSSSCNSPHSHLSPSQRPLPSHLARVCVHPTHVHAHDPHTFASGVALPRLPHPRWRPRRPLFPSYEPRRFRTRQQAQATEGAPCVRDGVRLCRLALIAIDCHMIAT